MTLSVVFPVEDFVPNLVFQLLFKFENFWTRIQWVTLETLTPLFSVSFEHFGCTNFQALREKYFAEMFNTKLVANLLIQLLLKFGNFLAYHIQFTSSLFAGISGWTVTGKPKDMTILESDIAQGLTSKVVHNYLRHVRVKFENFWGREREI